MDFVAIVPCLYMIFLKQKTAVLCVELVESYDSYVEFRIISELVNSLLSTLDSILRIKQKKNYATVRCKQYFKLL